ncbi:hypothetical protein EDB84DRAFT_176514 [Lactarius hengduanensis]|nr:hypothetical protein EDB84DRAFT_176514 [Lactarius hengduanensis]
MMVTNAEGEEHCGPLPHEGLDEDDLYLKFLQQVTHYPDDYHHEPSATVNTSLRIQDNPPLSRMDDPPPSSIAGFPLSERHLSLSLSHYHQDLLEGDFFTEGPSPLPPPLREYFCDDRDLLLTTAAMGSSPEFPLSPSDQNSFLWGPPQPPVDQNRQCFHPSIPQGSPQSPEVNLIPESCRIMGPTSWLSPPPDLNILPCSPISDKAYHEAIGAFNSGLIQASVAAIQESPMDSSAATVYTDERVDADGRLTYPMTSHQALWGYVDGFAWMSTNDHGSSLPYSLHQNEEAASPNFQSAVQVSHPVMVASSIASSQVAPVDQISRTLWCSICRISFSQRQGLNRHNRDKHTPRNTCPLCETYEWSSGRRYLFLRHLERHHPEAVLA